VDTFDYLYLVINMLIDWMSWTLVYFHVKKQQHIHKNIKIILTNKIVTVHFTIWCKYLKLYESTLAKPGTFTELSFLQHIFTVT